MFAMLLTCTLRDSSETPAIDFGDKYPGRPKSFIGKYLTIADPLHHVRRFRSVCIARDTKKPIFCSFGPYRYVYVDTSIIGPVRHVS